MKDNYNDAPDYQISIIFEDNKYSGIGENLAIVARQFPYRKPYLV